MEWRRLARRMIMGWNVAVIPLAVWLVVQGQGWWALGMVLSAHALWLGPTLWPACGWHGEVVTTLRQAGVGAGAGAGGEDGADKGGKQVWLTIDDGPDPEDTPRLLDLLDAHGVRATFFFIGAKAARHPELVREVVRRGHAVGNHTMHHSQYWFWAFGPGTVRREIVECQRVLTELVGADAAPQWFRAPAGLKNPFVHEVAEREGLRVACWSARGLDGVDADASRVLERLKKGVRPGGIVLMHEGRRELRGGRLAPQVLEELLGWLRREGWECVVPGGGGVME